MTCLPRLPALLAPVLLAGCASIPAPLDVPVSAATADGASAQARTGDRVRWGGEVIEVETTADRSCFQLLSRPLDARARPRQVDGQHGRFLACRDGFYDPQVFQPGRELTVLGTVRGERATRRVGEYDYTMPVVDAEVIYLWPPRIDYEPIYVTPYPWWSPWYGPWPHRPLRPHPRPRPH